VPYVTAEGLRTSKIKSGKWVGGAKMLGKSFDFHLTISQYHRMVEVGRDLWRSSGPPTAKRIKPYFAFIPNEIFGTIPKS